MDELLSRIESPADLRALSPEELERLAVEIRQALCRLVQTRAAHFASNLGVVELTLALHTTFDFAVDRLIWDTGHQIYPHKMVTGRYDEFPSIRTRHGLMGYPNPEESVYDLLMTGHAGCSVSTAAGFKLCDDLLRPDDKRHSVAVVGDGAFACGIIFEALNHMAGLKRKLTVVLNDNRMAICPSVGGLVDYLARLRMNRLYTGLKSEVHRTFDRIPLLGKPTARLLGSMKESLKAGLTGGMFFEELGFSYLGPVDGHNIAQLRNYLKMAKDFESPVLLHVITEKGHGFEPAAEDPVAFHAPAPLAEENGNGLSHEHGPAYTVIARDAILGQMRKRPEVCVITAAMCQGNKLEPIREEFPSRFFDVGICESHAVAMAGGMARVGGRPIVDIYSTFMQRSYDQIFQEVSLQNLPVLLMLDRAGLVGADGPTHHGVFDLAYLRPFPNLVLMAPGDAADLTAMVEFALDWDGPTAIRYPRAVADHLQREFAPISVGTSEILRWGEDGAILACGSTVVAAVEAAETLAEEGLDIAVVNARFIKPLDTSVLRRVLENCRFVLTVEEGILMGGFGSAVLEAANEMGLSAAHLRRLGIPDRYVEHGERQELLAEIGLTADAIANDCRILAQSPAVKE